MGISLHPVDGCSEQALLPLTPAEIVACSCRDPNTIFRGNSLTSKCIDETMKLAGMHYLHMTLKPAIEEVSGGPKGPLSL